MRGRQVEGFVTWRKLPSGDEEATIETGFGGLYLHVGGKEDGIAPPNGSVPAWAGIAQSSSDLFVDLKILDGIVAGTVDEAKRLIVSGVHERLTGILAQLTRLAAITR